MALYAHDADIYLFDIKNDILWLSKVTSLGANNILHILLYLYKTDVYVMDLNKEKS